VTGEGKPPVEKTGGFLLDRVSTHQSRKMKTGRNTHQAPTLAAAILIALPHLNAIGKPNKKEEAQTQYSAVFAVTVAGTKATLHLTSEVSCAYQNNTAAINSRIYVERDRFQCSSCSWRVLLNRDLDAVIPYVPPVTV
jgi:hypothetical protein